MNRRAKGVTAEREVADVWKAYGLEVRGLEGSGDHLVICPPLTLVYETRDGETRQAGWERRRSTIHSEVKRQERLKLPEWLRQAREEAPAGTIPVVSFRQNRGEWYACLPLSDLAELVAR